MKNGDIGNRTAPIIAFNIDNLLFKRDRKEGFIEGVKFAIASDKIKYLSRPLNKLFVNTIIDVWVKRPYSIYFITKHPFEKDIEDFLDFKTIPYTKLICISDVFELRDLAVNQFTYYFDTDLKTISVVGKNALSFDKLRDVIS